jgi:hypothetical protein
LEEVDWQGIFSSFYDVVRLKIKYRDASKVPMERLFCIDKRMFKIVILVEGSKLHEGRSDRKKEEDVDREEKGNRGDQNTNEFDDEDDLDNILEEMNVDKKEKEH